MFHLLVAVNCLTALIIVLRGVLYAANAMTHRTNFFIRISWVFMTTAAMAVLVGPLYGIYQVSVSGSLMQLGVAIFILRDRRELGDRHGQIFASFR